MGLRDLAATKAATTGQNGTETTGPELNVIMVGGGGAMFGSTEGPWNLSARLEHRLGPRLKVQGVIDPDPSRALAALEKKKTSLVKDSYEGTEVYPTIAVFAEAIKEGKVKTPDAAFVASPPVWRGSLEPGRDLEIQLIEAFPKIHIFLEKPVATAVPWDKSVSDAKTIADRLAKHPGFVSIGYCLRYAKAALEMKKILKENNLRVMSTMARYISAYELSPKSAWWDVTKLQGPIVEQATHICDLSRHFGGDVIPETISANALEAYEEPASNLSKISFDETEVPLKHRIPRATAACWKYKSGAVGTVVHALVLHGVDYAVELEVYADGYQLILQDPFGIPSLSIRKPGSDIPEVIQLTGDDPYQTEVDAFIDAIDGNGASRILCDYADAAKTYEMTWYIRNSAEESSRRLREMNGVTLPEPTAEELAFDAWSK
ncbi:hypothetical protein M231_02972 [Tremella mesenterica]|uniref:NAD binding dehydrogenase n=1 Tax=Tremella mesenterica TaxID=5217 RepID=A0A4Q1BPG0_TREME|nr:uncharacterized protein TREMEDRAFT_41738 [Tremella mesenterica DSM 1558]EIW72411.1 hypothetical protein TREMEDRAFT_41738 [Tremella mesenterica DSM 1558]RXK39779.1 hypothetical protein M231_02972 [Tremella mesenterica]